MSEIDLTEAKREINTPLGTKRICDLGVAGKFDHLPYSIRVLLEAVIRHFDDYVVTQDHVRALASYDAADPVWFFSAGGQDPPANFAGRVGAFLAELSYQVVGFQTYVSCAPL